MLIDQATNQQRLSSTRVFNRCAWLAVAFGLFGLVAGCGDLTVTSHGDKPLMLLALSPHFSQQDVPADTTVVAVFSDAVRVTAGASDPNRVHSGTFRLLEVLGEGMDEIVASTVEASELDPDGATVLLKPEANLGAGTYRIVISSTIQGLNDGPIGVEIESSFMVAP